MSSKSVASACALAEVWTFAAAAGAPAANDNGAPARDEQAARTLVNMLTPVIRARAARALMRRQKRAQGRELRQEIDELTQEVFVSLFAQGASPLRSWDATRGLSLTNFAGLIAEREISDILQSGRRRPWSELAPIDVSEQELAAKVDPQAAAEARDLCSRLRARVVAELPRHAAQLFELLLVEGRSVEEVQRITGQSREAIYACRSRMAKTVRRIAEELSA
jgi:RNA polymerase sigma-70 factor (ECF subfamily)